MKILAVETSTITGGAAIVEDKRLLAEGRLSLKAIHSERLMGLIDLLLKSLKLSIQDMDYLAVSIGPGSFTGLRVGISTVKGLAYAARKGVIPVSTLETLAMNIPFAKDYLICPMLDARRQEVYTALYRQEDENLHALIEERACKVEDILLRIKDKTIFLGDGAEVYRKVIEDSLGSKAVLARDAQMFPSPANAAFLALRGAQRGIAIGAEDISPAYLRKSEAEIKVGL